jgi:uncharacterized protein (TIGR03437 family)
MCLIPALAGSLSVVTVLLESVAPAQAPVTNSSWSLTGSLNTTRYSHTATLLRNGKVLVAGGGGWICSGNYPLPPYSCYLTVNSSAEVYDPATGTWSYTGSLSRRASHSATLLANGQVLVAGGANYGYDIGVSSYLKSAEVYDPAAGKWRPTGSFKTIQGGNTATLLPNGKVLAVGISNYNTRPLVYSAEVYDPATETWSSTGAPTIFGPLTLLPDGKVLNVSGNAAELYDPVTEKWSSAGNLKVIHSASAATLLHNGQVLVTGRKDKDAAYTMVAELYDPGAGTWNVTGNPSADGRTTLLPDGKVLLTGGFDNDFLTSRGAEVYGPATGTWSLASNLGTARQSHTATLLANGKVLVTGGVDGDFDIGTIFHNSAEVFDPGLPQAGTVASVSAASFSLTGLANEAITASFGAGLATVTQSSTTIPLPTSLAGTTVKVKDSAGIERLAPLFFVSPTQVNYQIPAGTAAGAAIVTIISGDGAVSTGVAIIKAVAPGLFSAEADGQGVAAAVALRVRADGSRSYEPVAQADPSQSYFVARPIDLGPATDQVYLILFGTGIRQRSSLSTVIATIGGVDAEVSYAGGQGEFAGLDQINLLVPRGLAGRGEVDILLTVEAQMANAVRVSIK